ncbi:ATPase [Parablastomonas sp. CN1-191]|uniref:F0F1 ATP synthase subunit B family protein n=1 Tax=Parablastomonas sp. CN1-191 TaxID=3400908 RepID=UPI003BF8BFFE
MPQISQLAATYASQIFWLMVCFGFVFFVIGRGTVPKVMETVDARDKQIAGDLAAAEAARAAADAEEAAWRETANRQRADAQALIARAKADAAAATEKTLAKAGEKVDATLAAAEARIAAAREEARGEIETVATEAAAEIALRVAGAKVHKTAARAAVKEALNG